MQTFVRWSIQLSIKVYEGAFIAVISVVYAHLLFWPQLRASAGWTVRDKCGRLYEPWKPFRVSVT